MKFRPRLAAIAVSLLAAGGLALSAGPAGATILPLPACSATDPGTAPNLVGHCQYDIEQGAAGYLGADDNHTHYRYVTTNTVNTPQLVDLDGPSLQGLVGVEECDPNNHYRGAGGWAAQIGLLGNDGVTGQENTVYYAAGFWPASAPDPCVNHAPLVPDPDTSSCPAGGTGSVTGTSPSVFCGSFSDPTLPDGEVGLNDALDNLAIYYVPGGSHFQQISFGYCDATTGDCQQAYSGKPVDVNLWEFGIGAFNESQVLAAPASIPLDTFSVSQVNCYTCKAGPVNISQVQPVNPYGIGGLEEAQSVNASGQVVMGPNNSLSGGTFTVYNGSTTP